MKPHSPIPHRIRAVRLQPGLLLAAFLGATGLLPGQGTNRPARLDYGSFRIIGERNIFNASRSGGRPSVSRDVRRPVRVDTVTLVGTLESEQGVVAFFDGSSAEYRKALKPAGRIAGFTVADVTYQGVTLQAGDKKLELRVGKALRREDEGEWRLTDAPLLVSGSGGASTSVNRPESGGGDGRGSGGGSLPSPETNEILRRLMEQREREDR